MTKTAKIKSAPEKLKELCPLFAAVGVTRIGAAYDGSSDSGDFDNIYFSFRDHFADHDSEAIEASTNGRMLYMQDFKARYATERDGQPAPVIPSEKLDEFSDTLWQLLPGGWEIDEGSYGEIEIDVLSGKVKQVHNERIVETVTTRNEW